MESISENRIIVHLVVWARQAIEFDSIESCQTIEKSAEFQHMVHIARKAANHQLPTTYGLQIQQWLVHARKCIQLHIFQIQSALLVFRVL